MSFTRTGIIPEPTGISYVGPVDDSLAIGKGEVGTLTTTSIDFSAGDMVARSHDGSLMTINASSNVSVRQTSPEEEILDVIFNNLTELSFTIAEWAELEARFTTNMETLGHEYKSSYKKEDLIGSHVVDFFRNDDTRKHVLRVHVEPDEEEQADKDAVDFAQELRDL